MKSPIRFIFIAFFFLFVVGCLTAQTTKTKVTCVGNSITYGYALSNPGTQSYPSQLQSLLGTGNWVVGNYGVSARTMLKKGDRPYWNESAYTNALASNPNFVMIELGTNDAKTTNWTPYGSQFVTDYKAMIQAFRSLSTKPEIWIGLLPPGENTGWTIYERYIKDTVNAKIKQIALETGVGLIDIYSAFNGDWTNRTYFNADGIHPTTAGAGIIAQKVKEMITFSKPTLNYSNGLVSTSIQASHYQWYHNGIQVKTTEGGNAKELNPVKTGKYKVSLKINTDNETRIISEELDIQTIYSGLGGSDKKSKLKVFNHSAANGTVTIDFLQSDYIAPTIKLFDLSGKKVLSQNAGSPTEILQLHCLSPALYILEVSDLRNTERFKLNLE